MNTKLIHLWILAILCVSFAPLSAQSDEKATVYIVRTSRLGLVINFKYFVGDQYVGKANGGRYLKLEIDAGEHLIWAKSENRSYMIAQLKAGKTYIIDAVPRMGALKAGVRLEAVEGENPKILSRSRKFIAKRKQKIMDPEDLADYEAKNQDRIKKGLSLYESTWKGTSRVDTLDRSQTLE